MSFAEKGGMETSGGPGAGSHPQEPLYSNFPWFSCMARSERERKGSESITQIKS